MSTVDTDIHELKVRRVTGHLCICACTLENYINFRVNFTSNVIFCIVIFLQCYIPIAEVILTIMLVLCSKTTLQTYIFTILFIRRADSVLSAEQHILQEMSSSNTSRHSYRNEREKVV